MTSREAVAKCLSDERVFVARERGLKIATRVGGKGLCSLGVLLEVWIRNDALTFNTAHHAGLVFLFRDTNGDHATVHTGERRSRLEGL